MVGMLAGKDVVIHMIASRVAQTRQYIAKGIRNGNNDGKTSANSGTIWRNWKSTLRITKFRDSNKGDRLCGDR